MVVGWKVTKKRVLREAILFSNSLILAIDNWHHRRTVQVYQWKTMLFLKKKWVVKNNRALNLSMWLRFEADYNNVFSLKCAVCSQFKEKLISMCNYCLQRQAYKPMICYYSIHLKPHRELSNEALKLDIAYKIAKENLAFIKTKSVYQLEKLS